MKIYTLINPNDDNFIYSSGLTWDEVLALVDYLNLDSHEWDVIEHEVEE